MLVVIAIAPAQVQAADCLQKCAAKKKEVAQKLKDCLAETKLMERKRAILFRKACYKKYVSPRCDGLPPCKTLTAIGTYPGTHFPIPYARHVRVELAAPTGPKERWGQVWQVTYSTYPAGAPVRSITWPPAGAARQELERVVGAWMVSAQLPPAAPSPGPLDIDRTLKLLPGQRREVAIDGAGVIRRLRARVWPNTPAVLGALRLRARWDGAAFASVDTPLGYFFVGHGDVAGGGHSFHSMVLGLDRGEAYSRLPMPFSRGAVLSLENTAQKEATVRLRLTVDRPPVAGAAEQGRLHATWSQRKAATTSGPRFGPKKIPGHVVLEQPGRGKYVGALIHLHWPHTWSWWGEGDWLVWSDESGWPPSYQNPLWGSTAYWYARLARPAGSSPAQK